MNAIIIYKGKYGATAQYSEWLSKTLGLPCVRAENIGSSDLSKFDCLILGTSVYIVKLQLKAWLKENVSLIQGKTLYLFVVCGTPADQKEALQKIVRDNVPEEIRNRCEIFFLPGRVIRKNLSLADRLLLQFGALATKDPAAKQRMLNDFDRMNVESLNPLIRAVNADRTHKAERILEGRPLK